MTRSARSGLSATFRKRGRGAEPGAGDVGSVTVTTLTVVGMTCEHCVRAVREELSRLPSVTAVDVDLAAGTARVESAEPLAVADVRAAVDEAGYVLA